MNRPEQDLQRACFRYLNFRFPKLIAFHCFNGGKRNKIEAAIYKGLGVKAGVSDIIILQPSDGYHGLVVELKAKKGKLTPNQSYFLEQCESAGYKTAVISDIGNFIEMMEEYMLIKA